MNHSLEDFIRAFQLWEEGFRAEPEKYLTYEEVAELGVDEVSVDRAEYFVELLKNI